ncbi:type I-C CRISPR-associated endonuclease Cas1c [Mariniblastus fucicola]|uniref:CRISPR-associated endonuclease Cas1 n=1 Tax=Mariniblastus fucicola TaxID=980251 RepID=A0A5B9PJ01_9BACT|nr:type I-C CRISPR-associated endonuclease Cas1c [Mariniblastus fucicola]QEG25230.1 CRISPR-associated protein Cas4/endonuclease Cas1 fusion [Mariniblastus fucicola]
MKKHLNTLFVTTEGAYLKKDGQAVVVSIEKQNRLRLPLHNLDGIVCLGNIMCSPALMGACARAGVSISFLTPYGGFIAAVNGYSPGNVLLRREQYRRADDPDSTLHIARHFVSAKIANSRSVLLRAARDSRDAESKSALQSTAKLMMRNIRAARNATTLDSLRGTEGESANTYFSVFNQMMSNRVKGMEFTFRSRRPPLDRINALLSFLYSMLTHDARSACEATGLDAAVGFLHRDRPGRPGLSLDLIEEFRAFLADRLVLSLLNRKQIQARDFDVTESGAVLLKEKPRKEVLAAYQKRKQDVITHPFLNEKTTVGLLVHLQARLLARYLRGDIDDYPPFVWR